MACAAGDGHIEDEGLEKEKKARCPDCEGEGWYVREVGGCDIDGDNDTRECIQEQCQWCWERDRVLAEYDKANPTLHRGGISLNETGGKADE